MVLRSLTVVLSAFICMCTKCTSAQSDYDVQLIGGHNKYAGQVQIFADGNWRNVCTCNEPECWTMREATTVCRSLGYDGALSASAEVDAKFLEEQQNAPFSSFNCRDDMDKGMGASDFVRFCRDKEINAAGVCDANHVPKTVTCNQKPLDFEAKPLYQPQKGYIQLKHGSNYYYVCADPPWNQAVTQVFCHSMGLIPSNSVPNLPPETPEKLDDLWAVMSHVNCTSDEADLFECEHQFGLTRCPGDMFAIAECLKVVAYTESAGPSPATQAPRPTAGEDGFHYFLFIGCVIAILFVINIVSLICAHRKNCQETTPNQQTMTPTYSSVMREDAMIRNATPPPTYSFVIKSHNRRTDTTEILPPPYEDDQVREVHQSPSVAGYSETSEDVLSFEVHARPENSSNLEISIDIPQSMDDQEQSQEVQSYSQEGHPFSPGGHLGSPEGHQGSLEGHPGSLVGNPGSLEDHSDSLEGHPGSQEDHCHPLDNESQTFERCSHPPLNDCHSLPDVFFVPSGEDQSSADGSQPSADGSQPPQEHES